MSRTFRSEYRLHWGNSTDKTMGPGRRFKKKFRQREKALWRRLPHDIRPVRKNMILWVYW